MSKNNDKNENYNLLLDKIVNIYNEGMSGVSIEDRNKRILNTYWDIGKNIVEIQQKGETKAQFGKYLITRLSTDLNDKFGKGFSERNITYMRQFFSEYAIAHVRAQLTWTHYRTLLSVGDVVFRKKLESLAIENELSNPQLANLVKSGNPGACKVNIVDTFELVPRKAEFDIFKVVETNENGKKRLELDCGFHVLTSEKKLSAKKYEAGQYLKQLSTAKGSEFKLIKCKPGERYCYRGFVQKIVDGDTLVVKINIGKGIKLLQRVRLRGVYAAELGTTDGERAKKYVVRKMGKGKSVKILTYGIDMYGRYIADVIYGKPMRFFNREMVEAVNGWNKKS